MKKKFFIVVLGSALAASAPLACGAGPTVYGKINLGVAHVDNGNPTDNTTTGVTEQVSRLGVKGDFELDGGLKAIYQFEVTTNTDDAASSNLFGNGRDTYAGLQGDWGTARVGFFNSSYKNVSSVLEIFGDTIADFTSYNIGGTNVALANETRINNAISYTSPTWSGFSFGIDLSRGETGTSTESNPWTAAATYKAGALYVGIGRYDADNNGTTGLDSASKFAVSWSAERFGLWVVVEKQSAKGTLSASNAEIDTKHFGASLKLGEDTVATTFTNYGSSTTDGDSKQFAIGYIHPLAKTALLRVTWTKITNDAASNNGGRLAIANNNSLSLASGPSAGSDPNGFEAQVSYSF